MCKKQNLEYETELSRIKKSLSFSINGSEIEARAEIGSSIEKLLLEKEMLLKSLEIEKEKNSSLSKEMIVLQDKIKFLEGLVAKYQSTQLKEEEKCKICNEEIADWVVFPCQDIFCMKCSKQLILKQCPICQIIIQEARQLG